MFEQDENYTECKRIKPWFFRAWQCNIWWVQGLGTRIWLCVVRLKPKCTFRSWHLGQDASCPIPSHCVQSQRDMKGVRAPLDIKVALTHCLMFLVCCVCCLLRFTIRGEIANCIILGEYSCCDMCGLRWNWTCSATWEIPLEEIGVFLVA